MMRLFVTTFLLVTSLSLEGAIAFRDGKICNAEEIATLPLPEHYNLGVKAIHEEEWTDAVTQFRLITESFPGTPEALEARYYLGVAEYHREEYEAANEAFSTYMKAQANPPCFEEAIQYKFAIAESFRMGAMRRPFGSRQIPKCLSGHAIAADIYDEIVITIPNHDMAAKALFTKGGMLWRDEEYREAIESFQLLIRRFPKHELAPESYFVITKVYLDQAEHEFHNPDLLALAGLSARKFAQEFPADERVAKASSDVLQMKEIYARGLYDVASYYERIKQPNAAALYYNNAIKQFPDTTVAEECRACLQRLQPASEEVRAS